MVGVGWGVQGQGPERWVFKNQEERLSSGPSFFASDGHPSHLHCVYANKCTHACVHYPPPIKTVIMSDEGHPLTPF